MARILHIETSTQQCGVALSEGTDVIYHKQTLDKGFRHAAQLHPFIDQVLQEAWFKPHQLEAIAVSAGPGSYTGLRIGSVAAKGLCFALDIPLIALSTLTVLAAPYWSNSRVVSLLDARRDEVYHASFTLGGEVESSAAAHILTEDSYANLATEACCFVGTGAAKAKEILPPHAHWHFISDYPSVMAMPDLAQKAYALQQFEALGSFVPSYIKPVRITASKKDALGRPKTSR